jgi:hypothetical protein
MLFFKAQQLYFFFCASFDVVHLSNKKLYFKIYCYVRGLRPEQVRRRTVSLKKLLSLNLVVLAALPFFYNNMLSSCCEREDNNIFIIINIYILILIEPIFESFINYLPTIEKKLNEHDIYYK